MKTSSFGTLLLSTLLVASAGAQKVCSHSIISCGCTITTRGDYAVNADLSAAQGLTALGNCIDINAAHAKLFLRGFKLFGSGAGSIGVHVLPAARYTFIEGSRPLLTGLNNHSVSGWMYGIESDADNVIIDMPTVTGNNVAGVFLNKTYNNRIVGNGAVGFGASFNGRYGVWIVGGNSNQVNASFSEYNGIAGIYVGCSTTGPDGTPCSSAEASTGNVIYNYDSEDFEAPMQPYGVVLEQNSVRNTVMGNNSGTHTQFDLFDGNANCANNVWVANSFQTANQSCIH
jgi:hypothetical protein